MEDLEVVIWSRGVRKGEETETGKEAEGDFTTKEAIVRQVFGKTIV